MNTKQKYNLPIPELNNGDVIVFHIDGSYTLNGKRVISESSFDETTGVPAVVIEEAIVSGDFSSLTDNKFLKVDTPQIKSVLHNVFSQIKRNNPNLKSFSFSILVLFAGVVEIWDLTQDRDKYKEFERKLLPRKLGQLEAGLLVLQNQLKTQEKLLEIFERKNKQLLKDVEKWDDDLSDSDSNKEAKKEIDRYEFYLRNVVAQKKGINATKNNIADQRTKIDSLQASAEFKHYNLSGNGNLYTTMQTNLISKYERITKLMEQFNITPKSMSFDGDRLTKGNNSSSNFAKFETFTSDTQHKVKDN